MTYDWSVWPVIGPHDCTTWGVALLLLIQISTFVRIINLAHLSLILARSSPVNSSYNECYRSDARHSTPSWHAAGNALLQHKTEKAHEHILKTLNDIQTIIYNHNLYEFLPWKTNYEFSLVEMFQNITNEWDQCCQTSAVWIAQMLMRLDHGTGGEAFNRIMTFLIILRRYKHPEKTTWNSY